MTNQIASTMNNISNSRQGGFGSAQNTPNKKEFNMNNIRVVKPSHENPPSMGGFGNDNNQPQMNNRNNQSQMNNGSMHPPERQPRMMPGPGGQGSTMPGGMNRQTRPQSIDPSRTQKPQSHNFGSLNMPNQAQRPQDDNFFGNSGLMGGQPQQNNPSLNTGTDGDNIDWGL
mmetsp:Transcript_11293/g.12776  ORF Transcript_11293/g.12776 Transcript_11293/m.12776 type:complete len:171 (+) Transcript_11293:2-514(+)